MWVGKFQAIKSNGISQGASGIGGNQEPGGYISLYQLRLRM